MLKSLRTKIAAIGAFVMAAGGFGLSDAIARGVAKATPLLRDQFSSDVSTSAAHMLYGGRRSKTGVKADKRRAAKARNVRRNRAAHARKRG